MEGTGIFLNEAHRLFKHGKVIEGNEGSRTHKNPPNQYSWKQKETYLIINKNQYLKAG